MNDIAGHDEGRAARHRKSRRRAMLGMAAGGILIAAAVVLAAWLGVRSFAGDDVPQRIVVIGESRLEDDSVVAGLIAVIDVSGPTPVVEGVDSGRSASIPGTAFDRLRDALPLGGEDAVIEALGLDPDTTAWIVLPAEACMEVFDAGGDLKLDVPTETTVFTGERLFNFPRGPQSVDGAAAVALAMGAESLEPASAASSVRQNLGIALGERVVAHPDVVAGALKARGATSSMDPKLVVSSLTGQEPR